MGRIACSASTCKGCADTCNPNRVHGCCPFHACTSGGNLSQTDITPARPARDWVAILANYREPSTRRSILEIVVTAAPFAALWLAAWQALSIGYWLTLLIALPAGAFLVRMFMIQHDCGHGAFFGSRAANDWTGRMIGVLTFTPYHVWRRTHAAHHATSGNLDARGMGDIRLITVAEYQRLSPIGRLGYRLYRHPLVMFGLGPSFLFLFRHRVPFGLMRDGWRPWASALATNAGIMLTCGAMMWAVGPLPFLAVHLPIIIFAASIGVWLFYIQHQFEETFWANGDAWTHSEAALHGSSHYDLPGPLRWMTANIGVHHVHHLYSRIPYYRLSEVLRDYPEIRDIGRITLRESLACLRLRLWDEKTRRLIPVREIDVAA